MSLAPISKEAETVWLQPLAPAEFDRRVALALAELDGDEFENLSALISWFRRRYLTPRERLAYARRRYESWTRAASYAAKRVYCLLDEQ
jgi:hypothetical protein